MAAPREYKILTDRIELAAMEWGDPDGVPVVAIHGWLDNAASFTVLANEMDLSGVKLIAIDLPGHGLSQHRPVGQVYHLIDYVVDVVGVIKKLNYKQVLLLGHSLGGIIAMMTAAATPTKISKLIMLDSLGPMADNEEDIAKQLIKAVSKICLSENRQPIPYNFLGEAIDARSSGFSKLQRNAAKLLVERGIVEKDSGYYWTTDARLREPSLIRLSERQVEGLMRSISCPTSLIVGTKGFISLDPSKNMRLDYIESLALNEVEGGHHFHMDGDVIGTANVVNDFIKG